MKNNFWYFLFQIFIACLHAVDPNPPHIVIIIADDLGWNDVGFHGSTQIPTPNIDALAYSGVILNNYYVQPICTPSRAAILSGLYPIHTGLNHNVILDPHPFGLPLDVQIIPQYLSKLGYTSHIVGKWHVGFYMLDYTPTCRGFDSHYGYWGGKQDYYSHQEQEGEGLGYDFRRNLVTDKEVYGKYTTDILTDKAVNLIENHNSSEPFFLYLAHLAVHAASEYNPLQAPADLVDTFTNIEDEDRKTFAGMLTKLDDGVGEVVKALRDNNMLENSVIIFTTDNGGPPAGFQQNAASNWPLRGVKTSMWEGGVRGAGCIWSPLIQNKNRTSMGMMHITDWLPTLYAAAGGNVSELPPLDGMNMWDSIINDEPSPRSQILLNIDPILGEAGLRVGDWKLLINPSDSGVYWDGWFGPSGRSTSGSFMSLSDEMTLIRESPAGTAIETIMPSVYENLSDLKTRAISEVLCDPIPGNATASCNETNKPCLFHISSDPCEYFDVSDSNPLIVEELMNILAVYNSTALYPIDEPEDPFANPLYWNYEWTHWKDFYNVTTCSP